MFKTYGVLSMVVNRYLYGVMVFLQVLLKANVRRNSVVKVSDSDDSKYRKRHKKKKRKRSAFEEKVKRVEELVTKLRQKHGSRYNTIQYRIWAGVTDVGSHE